MRRPGRGFTLLELLVAISLMALITGALYGSLYVGFKAHRSATDSVAPARAVGLALELLRQDFDAALPPTGILAGAFTTSTDAGLGGTGNTTGGGLSGTSSRTGAGLGGTGTSASANSSGSALLTFFSCAHVPRDGETACDIRQVELSVETPPGETQPVLMRRLTTNLLASGTPTVHEQVLCRGVKLFNLRYYDGTDWQDSWDSSGQGDILPNAVEVTLEFVLNPERAGGAERTCRLVHVYGIACALAAGTN
ncbi:MAG: type II secretion system protein GspJ [Planctomycetota bacterium]